MQSDQALTLLKKGAAQIISEAELREKLALGRPLRIKLGVDPTTADIHLGHAVVLRKLRQFQDVGHQAVLIIGDFTGMIGDPSGRSATRPHLTHKEVMHNAQSYREQAFKILDPNRTETVCNGDWFRSMSYEDVLRLNSRVTLQQMLQREDFRGRIDNQQPIHAHEIQYPIMQGWDSVMVKADVELGGTDQLFNILVGRDFQKEEGQPQQVVFILPILEGLDGVKKMSKSLGNYVGIAEPPSEMFGKLMSISDELMWSYYELLTDRTPKEIASMQKEVSSGKLHPMDAKMRLADEVIRDFHGQEAARKAAEHFQRVFRERQAPEEAPTVKLPKGPAKKLTALLVELKLAPSKTEAERLIKQKAVEIDGAIVDDPRKDIDLSKPASFLLRAGKKKFVRIVVE